MESNIKMGLKSKGFFKKLKDGDFGLAKTFWIYTFLVGIAFQIVSNILIAIAEGVDENLKVFILFFILIFAIFSIIYTYFQLYGLWNSANRYQGKKIWAILAKIIVIFNLIIYSLLAIAIVLPFINIIIYNN